MPQNILVPDLGDFKDVEVIEVLVKPGDRVALETPLITLETEKATLDVPSSSAGTVRSVAVKKGDRVSKGSVILEIDAAGAAAAASQPAAEPKPAPVSESKVTSQPVAAAASVQKPAASAHEFDVVVLGAGPGGYTAAFRAADLGMKVALIERWPQLGGVCLNVGCIPSKALLHAAKVIDEAHEMEAAGIRFGKPQIDVAQLRAWKDKVIGKLTGGLTTLARQRKVEVIRGTGKFVSPHQIDVSDDGKAVRGVTFAHCIIAAGSESVRLPGLPEDPRVIDSTGALELDLPKRLLVIGGGIIGLEMATVYSALGVQVSVVELTEGLMPGCDRDLVRPLERRIRERYHSIMVKTKVSKVAATKQGLKVSFEADQPIDDQVYDKVLVAVGRSAVASRLSR